MRLQPQGGLSGLLAGLDEAAAASLLTPSEGPTPRLPSPLTGYLLSLQYHPGAVVDVVDQIWPTRSQPRPRRGPRLIDRLPLVCYLLRYCDPEYGTVFNLSEAYRRLENDDDYRSRCGYSKSVPGYGVFRDAADAMVRSWSSFQECLLSPEDLEKILARLATGLVGDLNPGNAASPFPAGARELGWTGRLPPGYRDESRFCNVLRVVGRPRGRTSKANGSPGDQSVDVASVHDGGSTPPAKARYSRNWPAYNDAQTYEVPDVKSLLGGLSDVINVMEAGCRAPGFNPRRAFPLGKVVFSVVHMAYSGLSSRRHESLLKGTVVEGHFRNAPRFNAEGSVDVGNVTVSDPVRIPQFNTVCSYLRYEWLTPLLLELVTMTALPLRHLERTFAVDGTGWSTRWYERWLDQRLAEESDRQQWG